MLQLLFTFLDGAFRYDCATCGQACCRGKGIALDAGRELVPLLKRAPQLAPFLEPLAGGYVRLPDVTDGCWFLRSDGMCRYETEFGRDAKFTTCRLFPFNRVFRIGSLRVVDVNSVVCPIEDAHGSGRGVSHAELQSELAALSDSSLTQNTTELPVGARELRWQLLETSLLEQSAQHLQSPDYVQFAAQQESATRHQQGQSNSLVSQATDQLRALLDQWIELYGLRPDPAYAQATARSLTLLTPSLRFNALFRRSALGYAQLCSQLPRQLLATWYLSTLAAQVHGKALSLRAITELHQAQTAQRGLLARLAEPATLRGPLTAPDVPGSVQRVLQVLQKQLGSTSSSHSLGAQLVAVAKELPPAERALLVPLLLRAGEGLQFRA